jgi:uncharacterized protein
MVLNGTKWPNPVSQSLRRNLMRKLRLFLTFIAVVLPLAVVAQTRPPASDRKIIEISATEKVRVTAETATMKIGYQNHATTKDAAYAENTRAATKIVQALLDAGVPKDAIETETLTLEQDQDRFNSRPVQPEKYSASQQWLIRSKAAEAQRIVDIAVAAGANQVEEVQWSVTDPTQLEARAHAAALKRAKELAKQTATLAGVKLGEIVAIVNSTNPLDRFARAGGGTTAYDLAVARKMPMLKLYPGTVEREASVTVTYEIVP